MFSMTQTGRKFHDKEHVRNSSGDIFPLPFWSIVKNQTRQLPEVPEHEAGENEMTNHEHGTTHTCFWASRRMTGGGTH